MSNDPSNYGKLINTDIKLQRSFFKQMVALRGINCIYQAPRASKKYNEHGDLKTEYYEPIVVGVIFTEYPDQKTLKKMGWVAELQEGSSMIHVQYDLPHLEVGALFTVPSGLDDGKGRVFRVISMQNIMVYPASIACEIAPEYESTVQSNEVNNFEISNNTVLVDDEEDD